MRKSAWLLLALGGSGSAMVASCAAKTNEAEKICTPGAFVFCRCEDRTEGTKRCNADGNGFAECNCGSNGGEEPVFPEDHEPEDVDPGPVDETAPKIDNACKGKIGVVAGGGGDEVTDFHLSVYSGDGAFKVTKQKGPALRSPATLVPIFGAPNNPLLAVWKTRYNALASTTLTAGTWSPPESIGIENPATSPEPPSLVSYQTKVADLAYVGDDGVTYERFFGSGGWVDSKPRAVNAGAAGKLGPAVTSILAELHVAYLTASNEIVVEKGLPWGNSPSTVVGDGKAFDMRPALVAIDPTNTLRDLLLVYVSNDQVIRYSVRSSNSKSWSNPKTIAPSASASDGVSLASMIRGRAIVAWRGSNKHGFTSQYDAKNDTWSPPDEIATGEGPPELASVPVASEARCGNADGTVAFARMDGEVGLLRYANGKAEGPYMVGGVKSATWVGVGELP